MGEFDFFWEFFLQEVMPGFNGVPIILIGKDAQILKKYCFEFSNPIFEIAHPSYAARKNETWDTQKVFSKIQTILKNNNNDSINWTGNNSITEQDPF
jgi:uracil DNA glycosylase